LNHPENHTTVSNFNKAGLFRRLAALVYDALVVIALLFLASAIVMALISATLGQDAIIRDKILVENPFYFSWLMFCWYYYYAWCWRKSGQTLGMKAWRLRLITTNNKTMTYKNTIIRFFTGAFGLANFSLVFIKSRAWHDSLSDSDIILINKHD